MSAWISVDDSAGNSLAVVNVSWHRDGELAHCGMDLLKTFGQDPNQVAVAGNPVDRAAAAIGLSRCAAWCQALLDMWETWPDSTRASFGDWTDQEADALRSDLAIVSIDANEHDRVRRLLLELKLSHDDMLSVTCFSLSGSILRFALAVERQAQSAGVPLKSVA